MSKLYGSTFKTHQQCDAEAELERALAGGRGVDTAGRVEDLRLNVIRSNRICRSEFASVGAFLKSKFLIQSMT
jgi:hypothetical protein